MTLGHGYTQLRCMRAEISISIPPTQGHAFLYSMLLPSSWYNLPGR